MQHEKTRAPCASAVVLSIALCTVVPTEAAPSYVTVAGNLQSELGCAGDWQPECSATDLAYDSSDDVWQRAFEGLPAGAYEYKAALDHSWGENYGRFAERDGANVPVNSAGTSIKFYYDDKTHWITDNVRSLIATAPGSFQSELGCPGDWDPGCLRSWLQDVDEDGVYTLTVQLPAGNYETKVAIDESWNVNYGADGVPNGANIPFTSDGQLCTVFSFDSGTNLLTVGETQCPIDSVTIAGNFQSELGCSEDWDPACTATGLEFDANDDVWQRAFASFPAGAWEYKVALNGSWNVNFGRYAMQDGANIPVTVASAGPVRFYFDSKTSWATDNVRALIATAPGNYQSELGCSDDWDPGCLRAWLQDPDEDGTYAFSALIPAGSYETKVAIDESWNVNYGAGGAQNGPNIPFSSDGVSCTAFRFAGSTKILTIRAAACNAASVSEQLAALEINVTGVLPGTALLDKVNLAQAYFAAGDVASTCSTLKDMLGLLAAQRSKKKISAATADALIADVRSAMSALGCS